MYRKFVSTPFAIFFPVRGKYVIASFEKRLAYFQLLLNRIHLPFCIKTSFYNEVDILITNTKCYNRKAGAIIVCSALEIPISPARFCHCETDDLT